jgi:aryl-alcohol dehydrogenase-like predicted oxidoreductase
MNYRNFQGSAIAEVGLGTWQLGSADWGKIDKGDALAILQAYTEAGGNFIDTADVYGMGISEQVIGEFLPTVSKELFVATKLGRRGDAPNGWPQNFSYDNMKRHTEESLSHLGLSQLFLQQLHCIPTEEMRSGKVFDHLRRLQKEGLIRHFGASVETTEEALICLEQEGLDSLQIIFNLFRQHVAEKLFEKAEKKGVALIVRVPLASGLLSGRFTKDTQFAASDHRHFNANGEAFNAGETFSGVPFEQGVDFAAAIGRLLPDAGLAKWAIRWILDFPAVTTVIPGASKISQVAVNVSASDAPALSKEVHRQLTALYKEKILGTIRGRY